MLVLLRICRQMALFKEDFDNERRDKERAICEKDSLMKQTTTLMNEVKSLKAQVTTLCPKKTSPTFSTVT